MISNMKIERIKKELSQAELGKLTSIPQWRISLIERGIRPTPYEVKKISKVLETPIDEVFKLYEP